MYAGFYSLNALPFENTPDPRFFFDSEQHRESLAAIEYTIRMRKGFVMVTGDVGTGKTMIGRMMAERCRDAALVYRIVHGHRTGDELLRQVLRCLRIDCPSHDDHARRLERLNAHLAGPATDVGSALVLLVDEAQTLSDDALEELRLLTNFDTAKRRLVQVVLIGQPELRRRVREPRMAALRQRIVMAKQLQHLSTEQTGRYIAHRLRVAGNRSDEAGVRFTAGAVAQIHKFAGGAPRQVNLVCDNSLLLSSVGGARNEIDESIVRQVVRDMLPSFSSATPSKPVIVTGMSKPAPLSLTKVA